MRVTALVDYAVRSALELAGEHPGLTSGTLPSPVEDLTTQTGAWHRR